MLRGNGGHLFYDCDGNQTSLSLPHEQIQLLAGHTAKLKSEPSFTAPEHPWGHWVLALPKSHMQIMSCSLSGPVRPQMLLVHLIASCLVSLEQLTVCCYAIGGPWCLV